MIPDTENEEEEPQEVLVVDYTERMEHVSVEDSIIEEKDNMWEPIRKFLERSKRRKWGYGSEDL